MEVISQDSRRHRRDVLERAEYLLREKRSHLKHARSYEDADLLINTVRYEGLDPIPYKRYPNPKRPEVLGSEHPLVQQEVEDIDDDKGKADEETERNFTDRVPSQVTSMATTHEPEMEFVDDFLDNYPNKNSYDDAGGAGRKGKLVTFFRNGDTHFPGHKVSVSQKCFVSFESLLIYLNDKVPTTSGVRYVFRVSDGREITDVTEILAGHAYVVSSVKRYKELNYVTPEKERFWRNQRPSAGKMRRGEQRLYIHKDKRSRSFPGGYKPAPQAMQGERWSAAGASSRYSNGSQPYQPKPRVLTIVSNTHRHSEEKVILNLNTTQSYEEILMDITNMIVMETPPVSALYVAHEPYRKVKSFSHLIRDLRDEDEFFACGQELRPLELNRRLEQQSHDEAKRDVIKQNGRNKPWILRPDGQPNGKALQTLTPRNGLPQQQGGKGHMSRTSVLAPVKANGVQSVIPRSRQLGTSHNGSLAGSGVVRSGVPGTGSRALSETANTTGVPRYIAHADPSDRPFQHPSLTDEEVVKVDIHGHPREFYAPHINRMKDNDGSKPDRQPKVEWVYGYRGRDARNNLYVLESGELVYYVAAVAVLYDRQRHKQRHYTGHNEDITCMSFHPVASVSYVATAQQSGRTKDSQAHIRIWDAFSLITITIVGSGFFQQGITTVGFSGQDTEGKYLMVVDEGERHVLSVWEWKKQRLITKTTTTTETVVWGCFHPDDSSYIITYGKQHLYFWKMFGDVIHDTGVRLLRDKESGVFEIDNVPKYVTSLVFSPSGDVITGDSNGRIIVWTQDDTEAFIMNQTFSDPMRNAHSKSVFALCILNDGILLSGGGGEIKAWDILTDYKPVKERVLRNKSYKDDLIQGFSYHQLETEIPESCGYIRTLTPLKVGGTDGALVIGTTNNVILEGTLQSKFNYVLQGHSEELWAMATFPGEHSFVTAGYDQNVIKWSILQKKLLWKVYVEKPCLSVAVHPDSLVIVAGTTCGRFIVLNAGTGAHITSVQVGTHQLNAVKFSPDGLFLALGSHDTNLYVYKVEEDGEIYRKYRQGILKGHGNFVTHADWSNDSSHLQSVSGDYDLLNWNIESMVSASALDCRDMEWASSSCVLGFNTLGAWSNLSEGEDINTVARSHQKDLLAVGDNQGVLRLFQHPCTSEQPQYHESKAYSGHITETGFAFDDQTIITTGGTDAGLIQWKLDTTDPYQ